MFTKIYSFLSKLELFFKIFSIIFLLSIATLSYSIELKKIKVEDFLSNKTIANNSGIKSDIEQCNILIEKLKQQKQEIIPLSLSISGGFNGDKAGKQEKYLINTKIDLKYKQLLNIFNFNMEMTVQLKDGTLEDSVNKLGLSYHHNLVKNTELFGFIKRLSDSYMSIQERYEAGGGIKYKFSLISNKWKNKISKIRNKFYIQYNSLINKLKTQDIDDEKKTELKEYLNSVRNESNDIYEAIKDEKVFVKVECETACFAEFEKAEIKTYLDDRVFFNGAETILETKDSKSIALDGELNYRFLLGIGITLKPLSKLTIHTKLQKKLAIKKNYSTEIPKDFRSEFSSYLKLILKKVKGSPKETSLVFGYKSEFDNVPPEIPASIITLNEGTNKKIRNTIAESKHEKFTFSILFKF